VSDQAKLLPVKTSNLPDNCPLTNCYLQACKNVNISKTKKDIPKRKTPFLFTLKSLSNEQQLFFTS